MVFAVMLPFAEYFTVGDVCTCRVQGAYIDVGILFAEILFLNRNKCRAGVIQLLSAILVVAFILVVAVIDG